MKVLGLCTYPVEAAATRYRLIQFIEPLKQNDIELTVVPFLSSNQFANLYQSRKLVFNSLMMINSVRKRIFDSLVFRDFDAIFIQREAMIIGPPIIEWLINRFNTCPLILDLDDATYVRTTSPVYGKLGSYLKFQSKTDQLIDWSHTVVCGNSNIAKYVSARGKNSVVIPTVVDTNTFCPIKKNLKAELVLGWIGTHSTFPLLESLFPVLQELAKKCRFSLKIVGSGKENIEIPGIKVENLKWSLEREVEDFQSIDIGLYPLEKNSTISTEFLKGKSGFKAIQYMSIGIPFVVTSDRLTNDIGIENETHFVASNNEDWIRHLSKLIESKEIRNEIGEHGRKFALDNFTLLQQAEKLSHVIKSAVTEFQRINN